MLSLERVWKNQAPLLRMPRMRHGILFRVDGNQIYTFASEEAVLNGATGRENKMHKSTRREENAKTYSGRSTFPMWPC